MYLLESYADSSPNPIREILEADIPQQDTLLPLHRYAPNHTLRNSLLGGVLVLGTWTAVQQFQNSLTKPVGVPIVIRQERGIDLTSESKRFQVIEPTTQPIPTPRIPSGLEFAKTNPSLERLFNLQNFTKWLKDEKEAGRVVDITWHEKESILLQAKRVNIPYSQPKYDEKQYTIFYPYQPPVIDLNGALESNIVVKHGLRKTFVSFYNEKDKYTGKLIPTSLRPVFFPEKDEQGLLWDQVNLPSPKGETVYSQ